MKYKITNEQAGRRLDVFLAEHLTQYSRSQLQKLIKNGEITVGVNRVSPHYFLKEGDEVRFLQKKSGQPKEKKSIKKEPLPEADSRPKLKLKLNDWLLENNKEFLVINKPAGIIVHGLKSADNIGKFIPSKTEPVLTDFLVKKYPTIKKVGDDPLRPGIVHRLDKDVSGVMVVAKTQDSFENLKRQFMERKVKKTYWALVYGRIEKDEGTIDFPIERSREGKMAARPANQPGKAAQTDFRVLKRYINYTLVEAQPKTGRTHQIRCHLAAYGNPIVGDNLYGTKDTREKNRKLGADRIFLAAVELEFNDLAGERLTFKADWPDNLMKFLKELK